MIRVFLMKLNYNISKINKDPAIRFIKKYHYLPTLPRLTKHYLGFHLDKKLIGVLTLGWGTQPFGTISKLFPGKELTTKDYFEIGKMCLDPSLNDTKSAGSQMLSKTIKWMRQNTNCFFLYTLADGIMGKVGYVYQTSNFYYRGYFWTSVYLMENGVRVHPRSVSHLLKENAIERGKEKMSWLDTRFMRKKGIQKIEGKMFRYIYPLNKTGKRVMFGNYYVRKED